MMMPESFTPGALPSRDPDGHKGTFGTVGVVGGATGERVMVGSAALAALAALRTGCGLATIAAPEPVINPILSVAFEATGVALPILPDGSLHASRAAELIDTHLATARVLAIGPGFGVGEAQRQVVLRLISREQQPLVLDADALTLLAGSQGVQHDFHAPAILTPHPGEFARLAEAFEVDPRPEGEDQRVAAAAALASRLGVVVVLKGPRTVVTDGIRVHVNTTGNAGLATGGSGDVLTGICAGLVAQFLGRLDLLECAVWAAHLHGLAADLLANHHGDSPRLARDLLDSIPQALLTIRGG